MTGGDIGMECGVSGGRSLAAHRDWEAILNPGLVRETSAIAGLIRGQLEVVKLMAAE